MCTQLNLTYNLCKLINLGWSLKKMASQIVARRRIDTISGHFGVGLLTEDVTAPTTNLFPLSCSSSLSTQFRRLDNRSQYGRQASASQGYFMRQAVSPSEIPEQICDSNVSTAFRRRDNRLHYARQASASQGFFMRQAVSPAEQGNSPQPDVSCKSDMKEKTSTLPLYSVSGGTEPQFARPRAEFHCSDAGIIEPTPQANMSPAWAASECPEFAKPATRTSKMKNPSVSSPIDGTDWSPRINVAEFKCNYVIIVELPGVDIRDIRVEVDDKNLIVRGKRSASCLKAGGCSNDSLVSYHKREISQGQCLLVWPLPACANKEFISADFVEGLLQFTIPKL